MPNPHPQTQVRNTGPMIEARRRIARDRHIAKARAVLELAGPAGLAAARAMLEAAGYRIIAPPVRETVKTDAK